MGGHHEAAVADDGQHSVAGPHDLGRDCAGQPGAHGRQRIIQEQAVGPVRRELPRKVHLPQVKKNNVCTLSQAFGSTRPMVAARWPAEALYRACTLGTAAQVAPANGKRRTHHFLADPIKASGAIAAWGTHT